MHDDNCSNPSPVRHDNRMCGTPPSRTASKSPKKGGRSSLGPSPRFVPTRMNCGGGGVVRCKGSSRPHCTIPFMSSDKEAARHVLYNKIMTLVLRNLDV